MKKFLAIDIGASSGRHIAGWIEDGKLKTQEVFRFANATKKNAGHLIWDIESLYNNVLEGIKVAISTLGEIQSLAIDTWGVDYVLLDNDKEILPCYAYRDDRTAQVINRVHDIIPFEDLYAATGIQYQPFNTIYQLYDDMQRGRLEKATDFLMIPEYLVWKLTGVKIKEYTNATTTGLVNSVTREFDHGIINKLNLPERLFVQLSQPQTYCGRLTEKVANYVGGNIDVVLCATHDTASAVVAIPDDSRKPHLYLSSGTWSLVGTEVKNAHTDAFSRKCNFSNEGGTNRLIRYQKNIMGLWMIQSVRHELNDKYSFAELAQMAETCEDKLIVDCNDNAFLAPDSMIKAIEKAVGKKLSPAQLAKCIFDSLANCYDSTVKEIKNTENAKFDTLYIIGGGCQNSYLNKVTAEVTGLNVVAGPSEATAIGNLIVQFLASVLIRNLTEGRALVKKSFALEKY